MTITFNMQQDEAKCRTRQIKGPDDGTNKSKSRNESGMMFLRIFTKGNSVLDCWLTVWSATT